MTILSGRWDINYVSKRIFRLTAVQPTVTDTVLALYSALQDEFDEPAQMDDETPMSAQTPTAFTMINEWFIDNVSTNFLTGGAITTTEWGSNNIAVISYDDTGGTSLVPGDIDLPIVGGTTGDSGILLDYDERYGTGLGVMWIRPDDPVTDLFDNATETWDVTGGTGDGSFTTTFGSGAQSGEYLWTNAFALGSLFANTQLFVIQNQTVNGKVKLVPWWGTGFFDILIKVQEVGALIDDGFIQVGARQFNALYDHFILDLSAGGRQPVPLSTGGDLLNNPDGHWNQVFTDSAGTFVIGDLLTTASNSRSGRVTAISGTNPNVTIEYTELGVNGEILSGDGTVTGATSGATGTAVNSVAVNQAALASPPVLTVTATDASLGAGEPSAPYSLAFDTNQHTFLDLYGFFKYITRRNADDTEEVYTRFNAQAGAFDAITGEMYVGNELQAEYSAQTGAFVEGEQLFFHDVGNVLVAEGIVVADHDDGATGDLIMRNMRFFTTNTITQVGDNEAQGSYTDFATVDSTRTIAPVKVSPFGTLAGGVIFGAPGVLLTDILAAENQNFQLIDDDGTVRTPPITIQITVNGLHASANDRIAVFELDAPFSSNGEIDKAQFTCTAAAATENGIGDSNLEIDISIPTDQPDAGWASVVDASEAATTGQEYNLEYDSFTGQIFSLTSVTATGAQLYDGAGDTTGTILQDADADFITNGVKVGHIVRNVTDGDSWAIVRTVAAAQLTTTPLQGGTLDQWTTADAYDINTIPVDFTTSDNVYIPFILGEDVTSIVSGTMTYDTDRDIMVRVRNGGSVSPITPFEAGNTLSSANLTITAIRTLDTIAT